MNLFIRPTFTDENHFVTHIDGRQENIRLSWRVEIFKALSHPFDFKPSEDFTSKASTGYTVALQDSFQVSILLLFITVNSETLLVGVVLFTVRQFYQSNFVDRTFCSRCAKSVILKYSIPKLILLIFLVWHPPCQFCINLLLIHSNWRQISNQSVDFGILCPSKLLSGVDPNVLVLQH